MASWTGKKGNVVFSKPHEPSFLRKFKEKVGYKEGPGVAEKFQVMPKATDEDYEDADDELPQVVQMNPGDISQEDYEAMIGKTNKMDEDEEMKVPSDEKILFRKPVGKRTLHHKNELKTSTKKSKKEEILSNSSKKVEKKLEKSNRKLLSFEEED